MAGSSTCLNCGAPLGSDARQGCCPRCLFGLAGVGASAKAHQKSKDASAVSGAVPPACAIYEPAAGNGFGDYDLLEVVGRGGMGMVYRARQRSLDRTVALKMMVFGPGSSPELVKRFREEALAAAALQHPNIVAIHEVGIHEGQHFFVMDYVEGRSLAQLVANQALSARCAAAYLKTIAEAVHYAHERGILHRDLKPSNVLIDDEDRPRVVDFGLARRLEGDSELTVTGQVLGSPGYLPPEQAASQRGRVSRATDVYGLGATLYHLLTGRPPFQAESLAQTLDLVLHNEPVPPRLLNPTLPRDLETICLKCLEKEPRRRYATAEAVAQELGRFLKGRPVLARPIGPAGKAWRWCRRNPRLAMATGVALLSLVIGFAGVSWQWRRAQAGELEAQRRAYISEIYSAQQALKANNSGRALELLNTHRPGQKSGPDLRGFEWRYLWQQCQTEAEAVVGRLPSAVWSLEQSADHQWLAAGSRGGAVKLWNLVSGEEISLAPNRTITSVATFSPDGRVLFFCDQSPQSFGTIGVWDVQARKRLAPITDPRPIGPLAFSGDGRLFAYGIALTSSRKGHYGKGVVVLRYPSCDTVKEVVGLTELMNARQGWEWVFTRDSRSLIFAEGAPDCRLGISDFLPESQKRHFHGHSEPVTTMAISPDGQILATGAGFTDKEIRLWEVESFRLGGEVTNFDKLAGHEGWLTAVRFSPDGRTLASASADQTIRLWDVAARKTRWVYRGLPSAVSYLCFSRDGQKLFTGADDGTVHRWAVYPPENSAKMGFWRRPPEPTLDSATLSPQGTRFAGLRQGVVYVGDIGAATPAGEVPELGTNNTSLLFSANGRSLFAGTRNGEVQVWSLDTQRPLHRVRGPPEPVTRLRQDKQGRLLVVVHWATAAQVDLPLRVAVWNTAHWRQLKAWTFSASTPTVENLSCCDVSPDGRFLVTVAVRGPVQVWSLSEDSRPRRVSSPGATCSVAFSPDSRLLAAATESGLVRIWEVPGLNNLKEFQGRSQAILALAFSPGGRRLAMAGEGPEAIKLWDVATWQELIAWELPGESLRQIAFTSDSLTAATDKGDVLSWHVPSFAEIDAKEKNKPNR